MTVNRADFASDCVSQAIFFGVNPHYMVGVAQLRSGISDDTQDALVGPFRLTQAEWDANRTAPEFEVALLPTDITAPDMQCLVFALMTFRMQNKLLEQLSRFPSAVELYKAQWPNDTVELPGKLQEALDATAALIDPAAQAALDEPIDPSPVITDPSGPPPDPPKPSPKPNPPAATTGLFAAKAPGVMTKLMEDFGFSDFQAAGILGNIGHECNGFRTMQEVHPLGGGRGGFGWAQWTGPRRRNFEKFCSDNGFTQTSDEANYGFLKFELQGSQHAAVTAIKGTGTLDAATQSFEQIFEVAGVAAIDSRIKWAKRALDAFKNK